MNKPKKGWQDWSLEDAKDWAGREKADKANFGFNLAGVAAAMLLDALRKSEAKRKEIEAIANDRGSALKAKKETLAKWRSEVLRLKKDIEDFKAGKRMEA